MKKRVFSIKDRKSYEVELTVDEKEKRLKEIEQIEKEKKLNQYKEDRIQAYLPLEEQLDMMYWDHVNDTFNWFHHIRDVKKKYPKP